MKTYQIKVYICDYCKREFTIAKVADKHERGCMYGRKQTTGRFTTRQALVAYVWQEFRRGIKCKNIAKDCQIAVGTVSTILEYEKP